MRAFQNVHKSMVAFVLNVETYRLHDDYYLLKDQRDRLKFFFHDCDLCIVESTLSRLTKGGLKESQALSAI